MEAESGTPKKGRTKGYRHTAESREKMHLAQLTAQQKARATALKAGRKFFNSGVDAVPTFVDPDFDEGL